VEGLEAYVLVAFLGYCMGLCLKTKPKHTMCAN